MFYTAAMYSTSVVECITKDYFGVNGYRIVQEYQLIRQIVESDHGATEQST